MSKNSLLGLALATILLPAGAAFAQQSTHPNALEVIETKSVNDLGQEVTTVTPSAFTVVKPITTTDFDAAESVPVSEKTEAPRRRFNKNIPVKQDELVGKEDPALQKEKAYRSSAPPLQNFGGLNGNGFPPDPTGAAGFNHYVQSVNSAVRIYNKTGQGQGLAFSLASLWPGSQNAGDPIVMYDRHVNRWFISQFNGNPNRILIAISETPDPAGDYFSYEFTLTQFPDYPKYSIWWDGYYMTSNSTHTAVVFEREKMIAGDPSARAIILSAPQAFSGGFRSVLPADADGPLPPEGTPCYFFNLEDGSWGGVPEDRIKVYEFNTNWNNTNQSSISIKTTLPTEPFNSFFSGGFSNITQPGNGTPLDAIQQVLMFRAQYTRWVDHNTIMLTHAVNLGFNRAGIRWYELRESDGDWTIHQQSTFAPDNTSRWMSSAAMDSEGNIGMAYAVASSSVSAGIRYTGRFATDPLNMMTIAEEEAIEGTGSQIGIDRYGDYSHTAMDPDGKTFWHTGEYLRNGQPRTRIFSFRIAPEVVSVEDNPYYANLNMNVSQNAGMIDVKVDGLYNTDDLIVDVISVTGQVVYHQDITPGGTSFQHQISSADLASGSFFIRIGNSNFQKVEPIVIP